MIFFGSRTLEPLTTALAFVCTSSHRFVPTPPLFLDGSSIPKLSAMASRRPLIPIPRRLPSERFARILSRRVGTGSGLSITGPSFGFQIFPPIYLTSFPNFFPPSTALSLYFCAASMPGGNEWLVSDAPVFKGGGPASSLSIATRCASASRIRSRSFEPERISRKV
jgi:hypothetical protein